MYNDLRKNENKGFSLVELIVVIAIMAVMMVVLVPTLLQYVEKSRAQKDDSAMGEVVQVVKLALADQDVYDECLCYTVDGNKAYYVIDADETKWEPGGTMRGLTITFHSTKNANATKFALASGVVNEFMDEGTKSFNGNDATGATLGSMTSGASVGELNKKVQAGIEDGEVDLTSQTYRNSDYTIFIKMGNASEAVNIYGQWCGTNIHADIASDVGDDTNEENKIVMINEQEVTGNYTTMYFDYNAYCYTSNSGKYFIKIGEQVYETETQYYEDEWGSYIKFGGTNTGGIMLRYNEWVNGMTLFTYDTVSFPITVSLYWCES